MEFVETEGDTIDAAIESALKLLGVGRDKITVDIVAEGRKGILGFGAQKAKVRAALRKPTIDLTTSEPETAVAESSTPALDPTVTAEKAKTALTEILRLMGFTASVEAKTAHNGEETILQIRADNSGLLIGRKGQTLEALQYLVTRIASERLGSDGPHIVIDIENYRERQRKSLEDMALRLGEKAKRQRKTVTIDALSAADRRVIHAVLQDDPWVTTRSLGQGAFRRLLIIPEGDRKTKEGANLPSREPQSAKQPQRTAKPNAEPVIEDDED
jgi:spoIIIJ-associated protein